jgi:hypothetical protein
MLPKSFLSLLAICVVCANAAVGRAAVRVKAFAEMDKTSFYHMVESGLRPDRKWRELPADFDGGTLSAAIPEDAVAVYCDAIELYGLMASSKFLLLEPNK